MNEKQLKLLKDVASLLRTSCQNIVTDCLYRSPSQSLREQANYLDWKDKVISEFRRELHFWETGEYPPEIGNTTSVEGLADINASNGTSETYFIP